MLIAKIQDGAVVEVADYRSLFPNTSFSDSGPDAEWLTQNGCMTVTVFKPYDQNTQKLVTVTPYIDGDTVYTVDVADLTPEEITEREASKKAAVKVQAESLLAESDWSDKPSVTDTSKPLHLVNAAEWDAYRDALRLIAVVPPVEVAVWPVKPEEQWSV